MKQEMFDRCVWKRDRMLLDNLTFRLEHFRNDDWDGGDDYFLLFKSKELIDVYKDYFLHHPEFHPIRIFELGTFDGGSTVFWNEIIHPNKLVSIDISKREDNPYFCDYIANHGVGDRIKTFWGIDQANKDQLRSIVASEFDGSLDLVIDDASHLYGPTRASFEALFPLCTPGGRYIIEDWAWAHWGKEYSSPGHPWAGEKPLTKLIIELIEVLGGTSGPISSILVYQGFVVIERSWMQFEKPNSFSIDNHIVRRPRLIRLYGSFSALKNRIQNRISRRSNT